MTPVPEIGVRDLSERLADGKPIAILDVREPYEWAICRIEGAQHLPLSELSDRIGEIPRDRDVVVVCHHGVRSERVVDRLRPLGYGRLVNLRGGLEAWARRIDPSMPRY